MKRLSARAPVALILLLSGFVVGAAVTAAPATAAACAPGTGVTVVVGSDVRCASGGGRTAASAFGATKHSLTRVQRQPGAVCKVNDYPSTSCVNMPPADAFWGLFWTNGKSSKWVYASSGVDSLNIPKGGWVGFAFQRGSRTYPGATPRAYVAPKPKPKTEPGASIAAPPSAGPSKTATPTVGPTASASASADPSTKAAAEPDSKTGSSGALGWVAAGVMIALLLGMWIAMWRRRASS